MVPFAQPGLCRQKSHIALAARRQAAFIHFPLYLLQALNINNPAVHLSVIWLWKHNWNCLRDAGGFYFSPGAGNLSFVHFCSFDLCEVKNS